MNPPLSDDADCLLPHLGPVTDRKSCGHGVIITVSALGVTLLHVVNSSAKQNLTPLATVVLSEVILVDFMFLPCNAIQYNMSNTTLFWSF